MSSLSLCLPIQSENIQTIKKIFQENKNSYELFEVWLDTIPLNEMKELITSSPLPLLCVCKAKKEKGAFLGSESERIEKLIEAKKQGATFIDIGAHTSKSLIEKWKKAPGKSKLIISSHNFSSTPPEKRMKLILTKMLTLKPDIVKYVSTAKTVEDGLRLLNMSIFLRKKKMPFILMSMGGMGKFSRIISPLLGSLWMYAPKNLSQSSAPGQMSVDTMRTLEKIIY